MFGAPHLTHASIVAICACVACCAPPPVMGILVPHDPDRLHSMPDFVGSVLPGKTYGRPDAFILYAARLS